MAANVAVAQDPAGNVKPGRCARQGCHLEELQSQADFWVDLIYPGASSAWAGAGDSDG
jgi:hypothetical protein